MTKRDYRVELFRILATLLVVMLHVLGQGGILQSAPPGGPAFWTAWFLEIFSYGAVNCFALITGYIMSDKPLKGKSIISLWLQIAFYSLLITGIFFVCVPEARSAKNLATAFLPITTQRWWYISSYFVLYFFVPILNAAVKALSKQTYQKLLLVAFIGICCIDCLVPKDPFAFNSGYSVIWLMVVYLFGAYIKKFSVAQAITARKSLLGFFSAVVLTFLSKLTIYYLTSKVFGIAKYHDVLVSYTSATVLLSAIFLFLFCLNIKVSTRGQKVISIFSPATLGVYLIHAFPLVCSFLLNGAFSAFVNTSPAVMVLLVIGTTILVFLGCSVIDLLRVQLFKLLKTDKLCVLIYNIINRAYCRIFK